MPEHSERPARLLVLVRHAEAEASGASDHARPLSARGHLGASDVGRWLAGQGVEAEVALVSDATRTLQTWEDLTVAAGWDLDPTPVAALYSAGPETVLDLVRETSDDVTTLVVLGHNPTIATLAELLDSGTGDEAAAVAAMTSGYPPGSVTVLEVPTGWGELAEGVALLRAFHVGVA